MRYPDESRLWSKVKRSARGCWLWTASLDSCGRGQIGCEQEDGKKKNFRAARVAFHYANGPIPGDKLVMHTCDNKRCCRPSHLVLGTKRQNTQDAYDRHLIPHSQRHHWAKLTNQQVREIRALRDHGMKQQALADMFGCSRPTISVICARKVWKHV
jgi:hypothetical protein